MSDLEAYEALAGTLLGVDNFPLLLPPESVKNMAGLSDYDDQRLCAAVCRLAPGMTLERWAKLTMKQRLAWMQEAVAQSGRQGNKRKTGRPKKTEKDSAALVIAALCKHHGYENGSVSNFEPATNRGLAANFNLSPNALSRFLKDRFPEEEKRHKKYKVACRNRTIGTLLALWNRELPDRRAELRDDD